MSLYLKDKNHEIQNRAKEQKNAERRKWKEAPKYISRILSAVGVLCVLAVIVGVAAYMPILAKAVPADPSETPTESWESAGLAGYEFNKAQGEIDTLSDFTYLGVDANTSCYVAAIETEEQLKAVLSGLKTSKTLTDAGTGSTTTTNRTQKVLFKLTGDFTLADWILDGSNNTFAMDVFDGQGHTITCTYTDGFKNTNRTIDSSNGELAYGLLFGRVSDAATVRNLQVSIKDNKLVFKFSSNAGYARAFIGLGGVCGVADNAVFSDIEISGTREVVNAQSYCIENRNYGVGGLVGIVQSNVSITRCKDDSNINTFFANLRGNSESCDKVLWTTGGIVGQISGTGNTIHACWGDGAYTYSDGDDNYSLYYFLECGTIVGDVRSGGAVTIEDCAGRDDMGMIAAVHSSAEANKRITVSNCYGKTPYNFEKYEYYLNGKVHHNAYRTELTSSLSEKRERINTTDWGYDENTAQHYLLHPTYNNCWVNVESLNMGDPLGEEHKITITGTVSLSDFAYSKIAFPDDAKVYLYMTTNGTDDPMLSPAHSGFALGTSQNAEHEIMLSTSTNYTDTSQKLTVRVRIKVVFNESTNETVSNAETVWWSSLYEKEYEASDLYIEKPTLQASIENQHYENFQDTTAYPLGTTTLQLQGNGSTEYKMYYDFRDRSGLVLGETDSESTIKWETMAQKKLYDGSFTLKEDMVLSTSSNKVYMYVLAYIKKDNMDYYKLYEYDIVVFAKDKLISATRDSGSKIPNGSTVTFKVGNGLENQYPYNKVNVLISEEQKQYRTLEGQSGVVTYDGEAYKKGSGKEEDPYYLTVDIPLSGKPGQTFYVYVEPCVNATGNYTSRYGRFILGYTYTIMDKAVGLELSPSTITMTQPGTPTSIPIKEKIYMNSGGNSDIIVYQTTYRKVEPVIVTSDEVDAVIANGGVLKTVGESAYCWGGGNMVLYVRCNGLWYSIDNTADRKLYIYEDGSLSFDASYAGKTAYVSTVLFSAGYDPSDNWIYKYKVNEPDAVAPPTALLADGSSISMGKVLNFNCAQNCAMYYTTDGTDPVVTVDPDTGVIETGQGTETAYYDPTTGIVVSTENGFSYGTNILIKIVAYPVFYDSEGRLCYNSDKKSSDIVAFSYTIREQNQVETPVAYPETSTGNVAVVVKGNRISLSCTTPGAEIYYTVNGGTPSTASDKYTGAITVDGDYGSYFTIRAIAHKEGMKDSEVATCLYKIAEKNTVSGVTAIPSTTNQVIAGDKIILSTTESGADIYYTTDGTTPDVVENENGTYTVSEGVYKYDPEEAVTVPEGIGYFVIHAIAVKAEMTNSPVAQFIYTYVDSVGAPYGNPSSGTVTENTEVALRCANEDAIIYYEIAYGGEEPDEPTTSSAVFSEKAPIIITRDTKIKAFAFYNRESSAIVTLSYTLAKKMDAPTSSVSSGAIVPSGTTVSLSSNGGKVYYTTDGSDPLDGANTAVNIGSDVVITGKAGDKIIIKACTRETGATTSEMVTFTYQISQYPGGVTTDTAAGSTLAGGTSIYLMTDVTGGTIYYTTGSGSPITAGTAGNSVVLSGKAGSNITVKAVAIAPNTTMTGSYASFDYKLMEQLAAPSASLKDGTRLTGKASVVLKANKGKIYFTIDGTEPTRASNEYTAPIVVSKAMTIKAIAIEEGSVNSEVSTFSYTFADKVKNITSSVPTGTIVQSGEVVKLNCATKDVRIYYTTDGTDPSVNAEEGIFVYDEKEGISIYRSVTIKAVAVNDDLCDSEILSLKYQVEEVPVEIEREKAAKEEEEAGLKPSDLTKLESRRVQPNEEELSDGYVQISDFASNVTVRGKQSVISKETTLRGKEIAVPDNAKKEIQSLLGEDYELIYNYSFALYENGERTRPEGLFEIGIPIPDEYENADVAIISINENGGVKAYITRRENGYAYAEAPYLSNFAIAGAKLEKDRHNEWNLVLIMSVAAGVLVLVGVSMIIVTVVRRKRY